jgi:ATP-dependent RNA helicase SUPV3L1/SUV3
MHGADSVGIATAMSQPDYRVLAKALKTRVANLTTAILAADSTILSKIHRTLPPQAGLVEIFQLLVDVGTCEAPFALTDYTKLQDAAVIIDSQCPRMSIATRSVLVQCPVPWTIPEATEMFEKMLQVYASGERVDPEAIFDRAGLMLILEDVAAAQDEYANRKVERADVENQDEEEGNGAVLTVREASTRLEALELLHKMACAYIWMSYRFPIAFFMRERTEEIKLATEVGIQFCLEMLQTDRAKAMNARLMKAAAYEQKRNAKLVAAAEIIPPEVVI